MGWKDTITDDKGSGWRDTIADAPPEMGWGESIGRGVTGSLPGIGLVGGGMIGGTTAGPLGAIGGGGLGYAGGKELEGLSNHYLFGDELPSTDLGDQALRVANNTAEGANYEMGGQILGAATKAIAEPVVDKVGSLVRTGAQNLVDKAPEMVGNGIRKAGENVRIPFLSEKATGAIANRVAEPAQNFVKSALERFTGRATEGAGEAVASTASNPEFWTGGVTRQAQEPAQVLSKVSGSQFEAPIKSALQRGDDAYRSIVFLLGQQFPEFRKMMMDTH